MLHQKIRDTCMNANLKIYQHYFNCFYLGNITNLQNKLVSNYMSVGFSDSM